MGPTVGFLSVSLSPQKMARRMWAPYGLQVSLAPKKEKNLESLSDPLKLVRHSPKWGHGQKKRRDNLGCPTVFSPFLNVPFTKKGIAHFSRVFLETPGRL